MELLTIVGLEKPFSASILNEIALRNIVWISKNLAFLCDFCGSKSSNGRHIWQSPSALIRTNFKFVYKIDPCSIFFSKYPIIRYVQVYFQGFFRFFFSKKCAKMYYMIAKLCCKFKILTSIRCHNKILIKSVITNSQNSRNFQEEFYFNAQYYVEFEKRNEFNTYIFSHLLCSHEKYWFSKGIAITW